MGTVVQHVEGEGVKIGKINKYYQGRNIVFIYKVLGWPNSKKF